MSQEVIDSRIGKEYSAGFVTDIESDTLPPGLDEDVIRFISAKKGEPEWLLEWRLEAYRDWLAMDTAELGPRRTIRRSTTTPCPITRRRRT
jgi:Fe-S cluster assembly protein SufB